MWQGYEMVHCGPMANSNMVRSLRAKSGYRHRGDKVDTLLLFLREFNQEDGMNIHIVYEVLAWAWVILSGYILITPNGPVPINEHTLLIIGVILGATFLAVRQFSSQTNRASSLQ